MTGQELVAVAEQAAAGHPELQTHTVRAQGLHLLQDGLTLAQTCLLYTSIPQYDSIFKNFFFKKS